MADARRVDAPVGLAHAYDLVHLLAQAINKAGRADREAVRTALDNVFLARYKADGNSASCWSQF